MTIGNRAWFNFSNLRWIFLYFVGGTFLFVVPFFVGVTPGFAEEVVNTYTVGDQNQPAVAADDQGRFIVVWTSQDQDGDGSGVFGRRFEADGQPLGEEFAVNTYTTGNQGLPRVSADAAGNFIVVWQGRGGADRDDIFAQRFDSNGQMVDGPVQLNEGTSLSQRRPAVALVDDGSFLAVWSNEDRLAGRHFDDASLPTTGDFEIAVDDGYGNYGSRSFHRRDVEALAGGNFVVAWHDHFYAGYDYAYADTIQGAIFDSDADPVTTFSASAGSPAEQQRGPALAPTADGGFVVVWGGYTYYAVYSTILGRSFSSTGVPQGGIFDPTPAGELALVPRDVAAVGENRFLVIWDDPEIEGRFVATDGTPLGEPFTINTDVAGQDREPRVTSAGGHLMVAWTQDDGSPAMDDVVATTRFQIFFDGFESGDTSAWSQTVTPP